MTTTAVPLESLTQRIARQQSELEALQREYEVRQARLADLKAHRDELEEQLRRLDAEIDAVKEGKTPRLKAIPSKASAAKLSPAALLPNGPRPNTLPALLVQLVGNAKGPLTVKQLSDAVKQRKFPTSTKNLARLVQTRVRGLLDRGIFLRAPDQPGFILAKSGNG